MSVENEPVSEKLLYIITDSHLDGEIAPAAEFVEMLSKLENPQTVVFLGDLFKIWLAPPKFWTALHRDVLRGFAKLKARGCNVVFIAGNREMLLPAKYTEKWQKLLPFTELHHSDWFLNWGEKRFGFIHGDTLNYHDRQYLRWKAFTHNPVLEFLFGIMPGPVARWVVERIEAVLVETNKEYKIHFPENEIQEFAAKVLPEVDQYFVGHFHLDREIKVSGCPSVLRVLPDWLSQRTLLRVNLSGESDLLHFHKGSLKKLIDS
ncbi:MAG: metallophosphoesterase [SAR324 cluster bacterium]|nr:metallophosphoesterase [SAR324 cluster bacterium]MBL7035249.1 metallophosphoesterase [SAR324 cluster bacterium]